MQINPFIICNVAEQARFRAQANRDEWLGRCMALGATPDAIAAYDYQAGWFAMTTLYRNSDVVCYCRQVALDALMRGDPMPDTPQSAIDAENARRFVQAIDHVPDLKKRFGL